MDNPQAAIDRILGIYEKDAVAVDHTDGISLDMGDCRFNLRLPNTESIIRLDVESRWDVALVEAKTAELLSLIRQ